MTARTPARSSLRRRTSSARRDGMSWMVVPAVVILAVVVGYPIVRAVVLSFERAKPLSGQPPSLIGFANYQTLAQDPVFWQSLRNTLIYAGGSLLVCVILGLALALVTENLTGPWRQLRTLLLTPWAVPFIVVALLFRYLFDENYGVVNAVFTDLGLIQHKVGWLVSSGWALPAVMVANVWTTTPFFFLIFSAALTSVPTEVIEAARIDRAGTWAMITRIKLPYLRGPLIIATLIMVINYFNDFEKIWAMTEGGPGFSTSTLVVYVYRLAFTSFNFGYAATVGVVWLVLLILMAIFYVRLLQRRSP